MSYAVSEIGLDNLNTYRSDSRLKLNWNSIFVTPEWLQVWWQVFGSGSEMSIRVIRGRNNIIGIAPLMRKGNTAFIIGDTDVCDYLDFVVVPGTEEGFFKALLDDLRKSGVERLDLKRVRPDSVVYSQLAGAAGNLNVEVVTTLESVSLEMALPATWEEYLGGLTSKQRHELRRKLRRLSEAGEVKYSWADNTAAVPGFTDKFFSFFTESRRDKSEFLTAPRKSFFSRLLECMEAAGFLKLGVLQLDGRDMASIICFDYNDRIYLYNSGYDPEFNYLSVGLLSKSLGIRESIKAGKKTFDFLNGAEPYKYHLGGKEVPLYRCQINIA